MPEQAPWPMSLILPHEIMKLRTFTDLYKRRKGTFPKQMTIPTRSTTESTVSRLTSNPSKEKTIPDTTNHDATKQSLISFSNMRRIKELQRAMNIYQGSSAKTLSPTQVSSNLIAPSIKNSRPKMLNRTSQVTKQRQNQAETKQEQEDPT